MSVDLSNLSNTAPAAMSKETPVGTTVAGTITHAERRQVTDFSTGKPETWDDGNPKEQLKIIIDTGQPDPMNDNITERAVYIKLWGAQKAALIEALKAAGVQRIDTGGTFSVTFTGEGEAPRPGFSKPKIFAYQYQPPSASVGLGDQVDTATGEVSPAQPATPAQATQPAASAVDADQVKNLINAGVGDAQITAATGADINVITAIRNTM